MSDVESGTLEPFSRDMLADPYPAYRALRERGRVQRTPPGIGWCLVTTK